MKRSDLTNLVYTTNSLAGEVVIAQNKLFELWVEVSFDGREPSDYRFGGEYLTLNEALDAVQYQVEMTNSLYHD